MAIGAAREQGGVFRQEGVRHRVRYGAHWNLHAMAQTRMCAPDAQGARPPGNPTPRCLFPPEDVKRGPDLVDNESILAALGTDEFDELLDRLFDEGSATDRAAELRGSPSSSDHLPYSVEEILRA
jgi:hypothetical protein